MLSLTGDHMEDEANKIGNNTVTITAEQNSKAVQEQDTDIEIQEELIQLETEKIRKRNEPPKQKEAEQESAKEEWSQPLSVFLYFLLPIIMILPVINIVLIFSWTFGKNVNVNLRRIGIASMLWVILLILITVVFGKSIFMSVVDWYEGIIG